MYYKSACMNVHTKIYNNVLFDINVSHCVHHYEICLVFSRVIVCLQKLSNVNMYSSTSFC